MNYYQSNSVVNYPELDVNYTRIVEYKHFLNQKSEDTIIVSETTNDTGEPYYPIPNKINMELYEKYKVLAKEETKKNKVYFVGRLANYKYFNMDEAIDNALQFLKIILNFN
jgi:UDP-galactopyranose mutase